ncbi:MAG TPA: hypothetical protein VKC90_04350, partial [Chitinophagaceae bacterium]|nr:hypothetical protein [Chitinophagaceae bacterium]
AKPKQNEVRSPKINIDVLFILSKVLSIKLSGMRHNTRELSQGAYSKVLIRHPPRFRSPLCARDWIIS